MDAGNLLYVTGAMWSPGLAALATKRLFGEPISELPWKWGGARYAWLAYFIPLAYALPVYLLAWLTPLGGFLEPDFVAHTAAQRNPTTFSSHALPVNSTRFFAVALTS